MSCRPGRSTLVFAIGTGFIALNALLAEAFVPSLCLEGRQTFHRTITFANKEEDSESKNGDEDPIVEATVKIDDGGSDLTDRFKWKVNALMGVFDPQNGVDDDQQEGNILNAMLNFPVRYTFNIVGKTSGDESVREEYIEKVKVAVTSTAGYDIVCQVTPRGKNFTKVQCEAEVQNASMINDIYDKLNKIERTVMRF